MSTPVRVLHQMRLQEDRRKEAGRPLSQPIDKYYSMLYDFIVLLHDCGLPHKLVHEQMLRKT